jgi:hypothetical protein
MESSDVTKADERLRISANRIEIDAMGDAISAGSTAAGNDRSHAWIGERVVQVGESILIPPRHETPLVSGVESNLDD